MTEHAKLIGGVKYIRHRSGCRCCKGTLWVKDHGKYVPAKLRIVYVEASAPTPKPKPPRKKWEINYRYLTPMQSVIYKIIRDYPGRNYKQIVSRSGYKLNLSSTLVLLGLMHKAKIFLRYKRDGSFRYFVNPKKKVGVYASEIPT